MANLHGKSLMWAVTTGGGESHFDIGSFPGFDVLAQPLQDDKRSGSEVDQRLY
jgi:putative NADPH-quinone reductase